MITLFLILWPILTGALLFMLRGDAAKKAALWISLLQLAVTGYLLCIFQRTADTQFLINHEWVRGMGISFKIGMDGISLIMVLLTNLLMPLIILSSSFEKHDNERALYGLMLIMQGALIGVFVSLDAFLFYVFWELALIPVYFILLLWGGERKVTVKFFLYTLAGSLFMLAGIIYLYSQTFTHSFDIDAFYSLGLPESSQRWVFWLIFIAFAIKIPIFPFHSWQPQTYTQAPVAGTMLLSGIMLKMGLYATIRWVLPVIPLGVDYWKDLVMILAIIGIIYGAWIAINQKNLKTLFAFSSMSHVGLITAGILSANAQGLQGSIIQMLCHGINVVGLFFIAEIIFRRLHSRDVSNMGGLRMRAPVFATLFIIILLGSVALPLTNGFVGEFLLLAGLFQYNAWYAAVAGISIILGAVYMLKLFQNSMLGDAQEATASFTEVSLKEKLILLPVCILVIVIGIYPGPLLEISEPAVQRLLQEINTNIPY